VLSKENRLKKKKDFEATIKFGQAFWGRILVLKKRKNNLKKSRIAFVVSRKISPKAVVRNKTKRRLREIVRNMIDNIKGGYDIIFFTKKGIEEKKYQEIEKEIERLVAKSELFKK